MPRHGTYLPYKVIMTTAAKLKIAKEVLGYNLQTSIAMWEKVKKLEEELKKERIATLSTNPTL